jgi:ribose 5-phosphate isomerase A
VSHDEAKRSVGRRAAQLVRDGMRVGLGTGSTVSHTIDALAEMDLDITCVATSIRTELHATGVGLTVVAADAVDGLDIAIDGADEVDPDLNLTKGGGGALVREKIVAYMAERFVVVVDESKLVPRLGPFGTPVELLAFAPHVTAGAIAALGAREVTVRTELSDNENVLADARFGPIDDPVALSAALDAIPGVVGHGIFPGSLVESVMVDGPSGERTLPRPPGR